MATVYSTLAASQLKPITPHVTGFRASNAAPSALAGQRLVFKCVFPGKQVSKRQCMPLIERRNRCVCAPRASLDEYAPLTAAVYGACLLGDGLFACLQGNVQQLKQLGRSQISISVGGNSLTSRSSARGRIVRSRSNLDSTIIDATLQKKIQPGFLPNYSTQQIAITGTTLRPKYIYLRRTGIGQILPRVICCKSVIDSGSPAGTTSDDKTPDAKADGRVEDGSILTGDGSELRSTLRLVECAMLAATAGLAYFLSNLLRIEAYFGCFFPLPVVISSMRWGPAAGRKTMVATAMLLLILSGPLKAASYLLMHGFVGLAMGAFWKWNLNWGLSIAACTVVRCLGALGFVLMTSWLLRDNLLALITMNAHASLSYMLAALGINLVPTMPMIYVVFATLLVVNCGSFVFLLHVLYAIFLRRLGLRGSVTVAGWVERAI